MLFHSIYDLLCSEWKVLCQVGNNSDDTFCLYFPHDKFRGISDMATYFRIFMDSLLLFCKLWDCQCALEYHFKQ